MYGNNQASPLPERAPFMRNEKDRKYLAEQGIRFESDDPKKYPLIHLPVHLKFEYFTPRPNVMEWLIMDINSDTSFGSVVGRVGNYSTDWYWHIYPDGPISKEKLQQEVDKHERRVQEELEMKEKERKLKEEDTKMAYDKLVTDFYIMIGATVGFEKQNSYVDPVYQKIVDFCQKYPSFKVPHRFY